MALQVFILLIVLLCTAPADCNHNLISTRCPEAERQALTDLKHAASDPAGRLSSWSGADCCQWDGVHCDNQTGHVIGVHLRNLHADKGIIRLDVLKVDDDFDDVFRNSLWALQFGKLPSSLLALNHLSYLDLSANYFNDTAIPEFLGSFSELRYLNLSFTNLNGAIPRQLGRLSNLNTLSLLVDRTYVSVPFDDATSLILDNSRWLSSLRSLQHFEIGYTRLASGWLQSLNMLPSLRRIRVYSSIINDTDTLSLPHVNFTSLETLHLENNQGLTSSLFTWLPTLTHLQYLDLSYNDIQGSLPSEIWSMSTLEVIIMSYNDITATIPEVAGNLHRLQRLELTGISISGVIPASIGNLTQLRRLYLTATSLLLDGRFPSKSGLVDQIPDSIGTLKQLQELNLSGNRLNGTIPESLGQLSQLVELDLSNNSLDGVVSKSHFASLINLKWLSISDNPKLTINMSSGWRPPFDLNQLDLHDCSVGPKFPRWIRTQQNITDLDLSSSMISDSIPDWFWSGQIIPNLNMSHDEIHGRIPNSLQGADLIDLHSNLFDGPLPNDIKDLVFLDLSDNRFTGTIPQEMLKNAQRSLFLSNNSLTGPIPLSLCSNTNILNLDLSWNHITGQLPNCSFSDSMIMLDLSHNHLTGNIPPAFLSSSEFRYLYLNDNNFTGEVPSTLSQSKDLAILDLGNNKLRGGVPIWLDDSFGQLRVLRLSSNMLSGFLPTKTLSRVPNLQILDLSQNYLSGTIPESFGNFTAMMRQSDVYGSDEFFGVGKSYIRVFLDIKGRNFEYGSLLKFLTAMDLSNNNLLGVIPKELANLTLLQSLNVSGNHLTGEITTLIGGMQRLESLDLSINVFSGLLPQTLANLSSLGFLNVSYNNFSGRIPSGGHLDTFNDPSIYMGNPYLYKDSPADKNQTSQTSHRENKVEDDIEDEMVWFYIGLAPGIVFGFWALFGVLVFKRRWRRAYFQVIDDVYDFFYVKVVVHHMKFKRSLQSRK